jgi:hypothetical protein
MMHKSLLSERKRICQLTLSISLSALIRSAAYEFESNSGILGCVDGSSGFGTSGISISGSAVSDTKEAGGLASNVWVLVGDMVLLDAVLGEMVERSSRDRLLKSVYIRSESLSVDSA